MRTLRRVFGFQEKKEERREYSVSGCISFMTTDQSFVDLNALKEAITTVDRQFPWKDDFSSQSEKYVLYIGESSSSTSGYTIPETIVDFPVDRRHNSLRRGQLYAYEKYLAKIAEELAKMHLPRIKEVHSQIKIQRTKVFKVE
jgi:hypothetical protein